MKVWLPLVFTGGGSDVSTRFLAQALRACGHEAIEFVAPHCWQFAPWPLRFVRSPPGLDAILSPSWFAHAFDRTDVPLIVVERLFTPDRSFRRYRNFRQTIFHEVMVRRWVAESYRRAAAVVAISEASRRQMVSAFPSLEPRVIRNAVDTEFFRPNPMPKLPIGQRPVRLLFAGNLIRRKGVDLLAPIMKELGPGFQLSYTGGLRTTSELDGIPNAFPLGRLSVEQMIQAYWDADILLFPSRLEGMPRVVMEASACGLPSIVSDASSLPEVVQHNVTGRVCRSDDVGDYVTAIRETAMDRERLKTMGGAARKFAEEKFDLGKMANEYVKLIEEVGEH